MLLKTVMHNLAPYLHVSPHQETSSKIAPKASPQDSLGHFEFKWAGKKRHLF